MFGHDGGTVGQNAFLRIDPVSGVTVCLLTNASNGEPLYQKLFSEVLASFAGIAMPAGPEPVGPEPASPEPAADAAGAAGAAGAAAAAGGAATWPGTPAGTSGRPGGSTSRSATAGCTGSRRPRASSRRCGSPSP
ncbi:MAG TPA: hypothetical protein VEM58_11100, partial [Streptosporangiaceae bacterium]|nr:hypothetical protein [Streptosporangiaceae bacterium]